MRDPANSDCKGIFIFSRPTATAPLLRKNKKGLIKFEISNSRKTLTASIVKKLLSDGKVKVKGLYSSKKDKKYEAVVAMVDTGQYVNFKLLF